MYLHGKFKLNTNLSAAQLSFNKKLIGLVVVSNSGLLFNQGRLVSPRDVHL